MEHICFHCKQPCNDDNSKYLAGGLNGLTFGVHFCHPCYYNEPELVEVVAKVEQTERIFGLLSINTDVNTLKGMGR